MDEKKEVCIYCDKVIELPVVTLFTFDGPICQHCFSQWLDKANMAFPIDPRTGVDMV
jgi:hypothetical protein